VAEDEKLGPLARWKGGLEGGSGRTSLWHLRRLDRMLGTKLLSDITPKDIERTVVPKHAPATRNRALCAFRGLFGWAVRRGLLEKDPTSGMPKEHETGRTRVLSDEEIRALINGLDQTGYGRALRLLS
jgi:integrase